MISAISSNIGFIDSPHCPVLLPCINSRIRLSMKQANVFLIEEFISVFAFDFFNSSHVIFVFWISLKVVQKFYILMIFHPIFVFSGSDYHSHIMKIN